MRIQGRSSTGESNINRDILECKSVRLFNTEAGEMILIETYWNVNIFYIGGCLRRWQILIETYWNVNS